MHMSKDDKSKNSKGKFSVHCARKLAFSLVVVMSYNAHRSSSPFT